MNNEHDCEVDDLVESYQHHVPGNHQVLEENDFYVYVYKPENGTLVVPLAMLLDTGRAPVQGIARALRSNICNFFSLSRFLLKPPSIIIRSHIICHHSTFLVREALLQSPHVLPNGTEWLKSKRGSLSK